MVAVVAVVVVNGGNGGFRCASGLDASENDEGGCTLVVI